MTAENYRERVAWQVDSDDEFAESYEEPGRLRPEQVSGSVVYTLDWAVSTVVSQIDADPNDPDSTGVLVTAPPFQRRTAWDDERQSLFIESLMLGLPVPPLVLAESHAKPGQFYVLDGKQRLTALKHFMSSDMEPLKLKGLELLNDLVGGKTYRQIRENRDLRGYAAAMLNQPIRTIVVRNWQTPALLHLIFARLNKASVPLASHELRQALYPGQFTNFVNELSGSSPQMLRARRLSEPDFRLRDAETLLRYLSFRSNLYKYRGDLREFLDRNLQGGNDHFEEISVSVEHQLQDLEFAIDTTFEIFGSAAFLRYDGDRQKYMPRFNVAVFDIMTWYFADQHVSLVARDRSTAVVESFEALCKEDPIFSGYLTSTTKTPQATIGRIDRWGRRLSEALGFGLPFEAFVNNVIPMAAPAKRV